MGDRVIGGRYVLEREIGRGGMGAVWLAFDPQLQRRVALKLVSPDHVDVSRLRAMFEQEARAVAQLRNPHVVQVHDSGIDDGAPFIVMELLQGEDLDTRLRRQQRMPPAAVATVLAQVAKALHAAHSAGIVHRDLKPANIYITHGDGDEVVKVLDFGLASMAAGEALHPAKSGALIGTPFYMSPEQIRAAKSVDPRSDLWSLAVVAYRLLTGQVPFQSDALGDLIVKICTEWFVEPSRVDAALAPMDRFFERGLAKNPDNRFQSALEMAAAFAGLVDAGEGPRAAKILVVDDEPDMQQLILQRFRRQIRAGTYDFVFAPDGESALEVLRANRDVGVALTDINMPKMDGLTFLGRVGEVNPMVKVIVVSAYGDMRNIREAMNRGAFDFLVKPVDFKDLEATLTKTVKHVEELYRTLRSTEENNILRLFVNRGFVDRLIPAIRTAGVSLSEEVETTVAFVRVRGLELDGKWAHGDLVRRLNAVLEVVFREVTAKKGVVDKLMGDTVALLFRGEAHAERAVAACLAARAHLKSLAEQTGDDSPYAQGISAGLASGPVIWGSVGSKEIGRMDHTVIGAAVKRAAQLEAATEPDQVVIERRLREMVGAAFECQPLDGPFAIPEASVVLNVLGGGFEAPHDGVPTVSLGSAATWAGVGTEKSGAAG